MENKIKIVPPEGYEIDKDKSSFEEIVFKKKENSLPMKWEDLGEVNGYYIGAISSSCRIHKGLSIEENKNLFPSKEEAEAMLAMAQLCQLRDRWNEGWKPNWTNNETKYTVCVINDKLTVYSWSQSYRPMYFKRQELADKFLDTFRDLLEVAKPFL